ncbi:MAG TPA: GNAT family N-acetyltransferase [Deinococcales bacterium]|nr:GNAT family N-acetyltransferase [Deinococcales bacterium]
MARPDDLPRLGGARVTLRPFSQLTGRDWGRFHAFFRDREIAEWNGSPPLRMPLWLFRRVVIGEERSGERRGFAVYDEAERFIGSVELYDLTPSRPRPPSEGTLGIIIGEKDRWGRGYGTAACRALLRAAFLEMGLECVKLSTLENNARARRAFEKCGFRLERVDQSGEKRSAYYSITRRQWLESGDDPG